jgi:hypothetical protein
MRIVCHKHTVRILANPSPEESWLLNIPITHVTVRDIPPPSGREVIAVIKTYNPQPPEAVHEDDEVETKVVRRGRRPRVRATEGAETK